MPKVGDAVGKGQRGLDPLLVNLHAEDGQRRVDASEPFGAFEGGAGVKAVAKINEHRMLKQAVGPCEKRWLIEQDKVIDTAESVGGGFSAGGVSNRFFA